SRRADVEIDRNALRQVERASDELEQIARRLSPSSRYSGERGERHVESTAGRIPAPPTPLPRPLPGVPGRGSEVLLRLPLWAYPDRVCRRRANDPAAGVMVGGGGVRLAPASVVRQH